MCLFFGGKQKRVTKITISTGRHVCTVQIHTPFSVSMNIACHHHHVCTLQKHTPFSVCNRTPSPIWLKCRDSVTGELAGWLAGPAGGLLKRTFRCAEDVSEAKRTRKTMASFPQSGHLVSQVPSTLAVGHCSASLGQRHQPWQWRAP